MPVLNEARWWARRPTAAHAERARSAHRWRICVRPGCRHGLGPAAHPA